jgi:hypothetical protein
LSEHLFTLLHEVEPYPPGVVAVPVQAKGRAFFPGGSGLWNPGALMPVGGVMVLAHDFHSEDGYKQLLAMPEQSCSGTNQTWVALRALLHEAGIDPAECFFTNAYQGLRAGAVKSTGRFPGSRDPAYVHRCQQFLLRQLEAQQPRMILTLGAYVPAFLAPLAEKLRLWQNVTRLSAIDPPVVRDVEFDGADAPSCSVVALTHTSMRGSNVHRRRYAGFVGHEAELAMIRAGGPVPHPCGGVVFETRPGQLEGEPR